GKHPRGHAGASEEHTELIRLRREMDDAKQKEEYERAARLRDQIRELEKKMRPPAGEGQGVA
ncbi:MAG TPA: UvrB/UvrC motif-containing protein, partial [Pirellulaceae bacterium]|nr:UvrB/UvrC motif-containing protein [Pirellulaceae bacterium]